MVSPFKLFFELSYLTLKFSSCVIQSLYDSFLSYLLPFSFNPLGKSFVWFLSAKNLSRILKKKIIRVELNPTHGNRLNDLDIQSGLGTGTSFGWIHATELLESGKEVSLNLFIKLPTNDFFKSIFLTMFGVYSNELNFYQSLVSSTNEKDSPHCSSMTCVVPEDLYPKVYYAKMKRTNFVLILDDILAKNVSFPTILEPCPIDRAILVMKSLGRLHAQNWNHPPNSIWNTANRPLFCSIIALETLKTIQKRYQTKPLIPPEIEGGYRKYIQSFETVRSCWSSEVLTLVHGDTHIGNMHFYPDQVTMGFHDWQCVAQEHGMRDVGYFLLSSIESDVLEANNCELERKLLELYISELNSHLIATKSHTPEPKLLTYSEAWRLYRNFSWWTLTAFLISAGAGDLMPDPMIRVSLQRVTRGMKRINAIDALEQMLEHSC
jgi:thiamine kinase-like enzyme